MSPHVLDEWVPVWIGGTLCLAALVVPYVLFWLAGVWCGAVTEDRRWKAARLELGERAREIISFDTRAIRGWGPSGAVELFIARAALGGDEWIEPALWPLQAASPTSIRAVLGELEGTHVAHVVFRTRSESFEWRDVTAKRVVLGPSGVVEEPAGSDPAPPPGFVRDLEALARRTKVPA